MTQDGVWLSDATTGGGITLARTTTNLTPIITGASSLNTDLTNIISTHCGLVVVQDANAAGDHIGLVGNGAHTAGAQIKAFKTRGAGTEADGLVLNGDNIFRLDFYGADGADFRSAGFIRAYIDGTASLGTDMPGAIDFGTTPDATAAPVVRGTINNKGNWMFGTFNTPGSSITNVVGVGSPIVVGFSNNTASGIVNASYGGDTVGARFEGFKTREAAGLSANTIVASGDEILKIQGWGADGAVYRSAGTLRLVVDGTPASGDMPGRWEFATTPAGSATPVTRLVITNAGNLEGDATNGGDLAFNRLGKGLKIKEGANARMGLATLVAGTVTVANTSITATTRIFYAVETTGGVQGFLSTTRNAGTDFTINSTSVAETSTVAWMLVEPA
jgi:hypothetical protein